MTITKKIIGEFKGTKFAKEGGSCFECCDYEGMYVELKSFILHFARQIATEAIEAVRLEEIKTEENSCNKYYNLAIYDMEQKAKKFLEDNK